MLCWKLHVNGGPTTSGHAAVAVGDQVYSFGGVRNGRDDRIDVHVFKTVSLRWTKLTPVTPERGERHLEVPSTLYGHTAVLIKSVVYIWGGYTYVVDQCHNGLYVFDVDTHRWSKPEVSGTVPEGRCHHSACVLGKVMYVHGGYNHVTSYRNDMHRLDTTTMVWSINTVVAPLPALSSHSATIIGTKMFVFGGKPLVNNNISVFDIETDCWLRTPSARIGPEHHWGHSAFTYNGELFIVGGKTIVGRMKKKDKTIGRTTYIDDNDLWKFNPKSLSWKKVEPKGLNLLYPRGYRMCCCVVGDCVVLFGGENPPGDMYVIDLNPSLKTLSKLAVIQYGLEQSGLPHNIRWDLAAMTNNGKLDMVQ